MNVQINKKILSLVLTMSVLLSGVTSSVAHADTASSWTTKTVNGRSYKFDSEVWNCMSDSKNAVQAVAQVMTCDYMNAKAGYMGAQARLYDANRQLRKSGDLVYNSRDCVNLYAYSPKATSTTTYFYAQSKIKLYNGNGYTTFTANESPNCKVKTAALSIESNWEEAFGFTTFGKGGKRLSYGSGLQVNDMGDEPDLIEAVGVNNQSGYVKSDDLMIEASTPQEACQAVQKGAGSYSIPVYDLNGNVIDQFVVGR